MILESSTSRIGFLRKLGGLAAAGIGLGLVEGAPSASATTGGLRMGRVDPNGTMSPNTVTFKCCETSGCDSACHNAGYNYGYYCQNIYCGTFCACWNSRPVPAGDCYAYTEPGC